MNEMTQLNENAGLAATGSVFGNGDYLENETISDNSQEVKIDLQMCLISLSTKTDYDSTHMAIRLIDSADSKDLLTPAEWCQCFDMDYTKWDGQLSALTNILTLSFNPLVASMKRVLSV